MNVLRQEDDNFYRDLKWYYAVENSEVGVWDYNAETNTVFFSKCSKAIIGFEDDDTFGNNLDAWNDRVHPDDREQYHKDYQDHIKGLKPYYYNEHRIRCKDGTYKWILDKGKIVEKDAQGNPLRFIGTHVDITEHAENEIKLGKTLDILTKHNNRLRNFAHIVTHNLKQHAGNFESLLEMYDEASDAEKDELVIHLKVLSASLTKTIVNLNEVVSVQTSKNKKIEKIFVSQEIDSMLNTLDMVIQDSHAIVKNNVDKKLFVHYNPLYFESVIQNLIINAIKYKHPERAPLITIDSYYDAKDIKIIIKDNGLGIDLEKFGGDIFGLYKTFHHNDNAEGVGLYLIKNQIESFGGRIEVESQVNKGTTFTITAPNSIAEN